MAGTLRRKISRPLRQPGFNEEVLRLFVELEHMDDQSSVEFGSGSKRLANALGLGDELFFSGCCVNDRSEEPPWPDGHLANDDWDRCHTMRLALLETIKSRSPVLSEAEAAAVRQAAIPIPDERREAFFEQVASSLQGRPSPGPGDVHRAIVDAQRKCVSYPTLDRMNGTTGHDLKLFHKRG